MQEILITNKDFGLEPKPFTENVFVRYAARGIVIDPATGKIAVVCKRKINEYKLPGGGKEGNETEEENFYREIWEETGCKVKIIKKLCTVKEERSSLDMKQTSVVFVSELVENTGEIHPDEEEIKQGLVLEWMSLDDAIDAVRNSFDVVLGDEKRSTYSAHFVIKRDLKILETYKASQIAELENFIFENIGNQRVAAYRMSDLVGALIGLKPATAIIFHEKEIEKWDIDQFLKILQSLGLQVASYAMDPTKEFNLSRDDELYGEKEEEFYISRDIKTAEQLHDAFGRMRVALKNKQQTEWVEATREIGKLLGYPETATEDFVIDKNLDSKNRKARMARNRYYAHSEKYEEQEFEAYEKKLHQALVELAPKSAEALKAETTKRWL